MSGTLKGTVGPLIICTYLAVSMAWASGDWRGALYGGALAAALLLIVSGMLIGFMLAKRRYHALVRPLILARPPSAPGSRARCCSFGGQLPTAPGAFLACDYCGATNLVTPELADFHSDALGNEAAYYEARAEGAATHLHEHVAYVHKAITAGYGAALAAIALLALGVLAAIFWPHL